MGACQSQAAEQHKKKLLNKPQISANLGIDQQFNILIGDIVSDYIWAMKPEYETLIIDIIQSLKIRKLGEFLMQFKNHKYQIVKGESLYLKMMQFILYENKWTDADRQISEYALILLTTIYHTAKYQKLEVGKENLWQERCLNVFRKHLNLPETAGIQEMVDNLTTQVSQRVEEIKPAPEVKRMSMAALTSQVNHYLQDLYNETIHTLLDEDLVPMQIIQNKHQKYDLPKPFELKFSVEQVKRASVVLQKFDLNTYSKQEITDIIIYVLMKPINQRSQVDVIMLRCATKQIQFFEDLDSELLVEQCCKALQYRFVKAGHYVFREGDEGDNFYVIIKGRVQILKTPEFEMNELSQLQSGDSFGERAMDEDTLRTASVRTLLDCDFAFLSKKDFNEILQSVKYQLKKTYFEEFANLDIFRDWKFQDVKLLYDKSKIQKYSMHHTVYREGDHLDFVYIIKKGEFKIVKIIKTSTIDLNEAFKGDFEKILSSMCKQKVKTSSEILEARYQKEKYGNMYYLEKLKPVTIKYITPGQMFGELELLMENSGQRTHSVQSVTDQSEVYAIKREQFDMIIERIPSIRKALKALSEQKNKNFVHQLLQYERHFNDLTEVKKDLEKNINLDFLQLGSKQKPSLVSIKPIVTSPTAARKLVIKPLLTDRVPKKEFKKEFLRRKYNGSQTELKLPMMSQTVTDNFQFNFIRSK